jgi:hypothetical protein
MTLVTIAIPTVHLNGTSYDSLYDSYIMALQMVSDAHEYLQTNTAPHGRDYYMQGDNAQAIAGNQHRARVARLESVMNELVVIVAGLSEQRPIKELP